VTRRPIVSWDQEDAFTGWRRVLHWQKGELRKIKRREAKLERRRGREEIKEQRD
jgi:hypothetical protein